jgi:hypothetical protein
MNEEGRVETPCLNLDWEPKVPLCVHPRNPVLVSRKLPFLNYNLLRLGAMSP